MKRFVDNFKSIYGIVETLDSYTVSGILDIASQIFERESTELANEQVECMGTNEETAPYSVVLKELVKNKNLSEVISVFEDEASLELIYGILRYWLLPEPSFIPVNDGTEGDDECFDKILVYTSVEGLLVSATEIHSLAYGAKLVFEFGNLFEDLFTVAVLVHNLRPDLTLRLRMQGVRNINIEGYRLKKKRRKLPDKKLHLLCMAKAPGEWTNVQLLKDKGLIPYMLYKNHGMDSVMVGVDNGDYPYLKTYVNGLKMDFLPDGDEETKCTYLTTHAIDTDILIVDGIYPINIRLVKIFKELNPKGLVYMGLDANGFWMERIDIMDEGNYALMSQVDVIATSGRSLQRHLNEKWPWNIEYVPNGYFHPWIEVGEAPYLHKDKVMLTVGRLGTDQKDTRTMLEAFALAADGIPEWKLRLVGSMEEEFLDYVEDFYQMYPGLKNRVEFVGRIVDKKSLYEEYMKAAIFTLTSQAEGGTPNVIAEALHCGCAIAVTKIDAWEDCVDKGRCGMACEIGDVEAVADMYVSMDSDEKKLDCMCRRAFAYAKENYDMEKIANRVYESLLEVM